MSEEKREIRIHFPESLHGGAYANNMSVAHSKEEFIVDFLMIAPPAGAVTARIVTSPGHMKRMLAALTANVQQYEDTYGEIEPATPPPGGPIQPPPTKH
ncbi:MAG: DUF3467 domain-containing protein [Desulfatibacillaceae bacterium]